MKELSVVARIILEADLLGVQVFFGSEENTVLIGEEIKYFDSHDELLTYLQGETDGKEISFD